MTANSEVISGDQAITSAQPTTRESGCSVNTTAFVESNRAIAVSSIHVFIRLGPAFEGRRLVRTIRREASSFVYDSR
jgi:hypothetical protein